jgi:hypothetical protein
MDWDNKGTTSLSDLFAASEIGKKEVRRADGSTCTVYFAYKDGSPVKTVCGAKEKRYDHP